MQENSTIQVEIIGHTDNTGNKKQPILSEQRAISVKNNSAKHLVFPKPEC